MQLRTQGAARTRFCAWVLSIILLLTARANANFIGLGQAGQYSLFCVSNTQWAMNNSQIGGRMGAGPGVTYNWSGGGGGAYSGPIDYQTGGVVPPAASLGVSPTPAVNPRDMTQPVLDARAAAASAASLLPTQVLLGNEINDTSATINGNGGENVIDIAQVNITSPSTSITINGTANDTFIFRVAGQFNVGNGVIRASGGVTPNHILWYFPNTSSIKSPNGAWDGTILALSSPIQEDNTPASLNPCRGSIIASDDAANNQTWVFSVVSGFKLDPAPFQNVPEPAALGVLALSCLLVKRRKM